MAGWICRALAVVGASALCVALAPAALAAPVVDGEFTIPSGVGANNEIVQGPDGNMWVTLENSNGVARITPDGTVTEFAVDNTSSGITVGPDGNLWVSTVIGVAKIVPASGASTAFGLGGFSGGAGITAGPDGKLWVVGGDELVSFSPGDPTGTADSNQIVGMNGKGMDTGSDGLLWIADGSGRVISATAATTPVTVFYDVGGGPQDVAAGAGGQVAYANPGDTPHEVGLISPAGTPEQIPITTSDPFGAAFGADGAYWVARSSTDDLMRLAPDGTTSMLTGFSASGSVGPRKLAAGPGNTLWVTLDAQDKVARVTGVESAAPKTKITRGPRGKVETDGRKAEVKFKFRSPTEGAKFQCQLKEEGGGKARHERRRAGFERCRSPKTYDLRPGRYAFRVRAVADGVKDPTSAKRTFRVVRG